VSFQRLTRGRTCPVECCTAYEEGLEPRTEWLNHPALHVADNVQMTRCSSRWIGAPAETPLLLQETNPGIYALVSNGGRNLPLGIIGRPSKDICLSISNLGVRSITISLPEKAIS
jgi:hypothetical protein